MKSSDTSAKNSWPIREQNEAIHDSGAPSDDDISNEAETDEERVDSDS
jgi:hypothetical protein